jgi:hypothetical protein
MARLSGDGTFLPRHFPRHWGRLVANVDLGRVNWRVGPGVTATSETLTAPTLDELRAILITRGLVCVTRSDEDVPNIVETWM